MNAEPENARQAPESRSTEFRPVDGPAETTSAEGLLLAAYLLLWALLLGFVYRTWRRQGALEARVAELAARLPRTPGAP